MGRDLLTPEERRAVRALERVAKKWPASLWLFSASGRLHVMKCKSDGSRAFLPGSYAIDDGGVDPAYDVCTVHIPNDGGDW